MPKQARVLVVGGGVAAAHAAQALCDRKEELPEVPDKPLCVILSAYPSGISPYDRSRISKDALDCTRLDATSFPSLGLPEGVELWSGKVVTRCDADRKCVTYRDAITGDEDEITYEKLIIATGARAKVLDDVPFLWPDKHSDIVDNGSIEEGVEDVACALAPAPGPAPAEGLAPSPRIRPWCLKADKNCGFGSVHYLRDIGDAAKVSESVACKEADGQETCSDPVVIVGGGVLTMELAAKIARFRGQKVPVTVVLSRDRIMPKIFREDVEPEAGSLGAKDVAEFYERQLVKAGVKFVREHRCLRLWDVEECGEFATMEGPAISLQRTRPRRFEEVQGEYFSTCRGIVVENNHSQERSWIAAKCVILALGDEPNSQVFSFLDLAEDQSIKVDATCRTSHSSGDVFAVGDVASYPLPRSKERCMRLPHYQQAFSTATYAAHQCIEAMKQPSRPGTRDSRRSIVADPFDPVPCITSQVLDLGWAFYGRNVGECVPLGFDGNSDRYFGCFWVEDMRVVGCFLEGGSDEEKATCEEIAEIRPRLTRMHKFRSLEVEDFLADPLAMEPPELGPGEFNAELDAKYIAIAFDKYGRDGQAKIQAMGDLMRDLGADWDAEEEKEALRALDPLGSNQVSLECFTEWWLN